MKTKEKLGEATIQETLNGLSEGLKPAIENFDATTLDRSERTEIIQLLDELEAKALEVRAKFD